MVGEEKLPLGFGAMVDMKVDEKAICFSYDLSVFLSRSLNISNIILPNFRTSS